jgi:serine/threonine protein kinase
VFDEKSEEAARRHHFYVLRLEGKIRGEPSFVTEWAFQGSLSDYLAKVGAAGEITLNLAQATLFAKELAMAVAWLHGFNGPDHTPTPVLHRDIKSANVLVTQESQTQLADNMLHIRLADFDLCRTESECDVMRHLNEFKGGSHHYAAPEIWPVPDRESEAECPDSFGQIPWPCAVTCKSDVYGLGCVLAELFSLRAPWSTCHQSLESVTGQGGPAFRPARFKSLRAWVESREAPPEWRHLAPSLAQVPQFRAALQLLLEECLAFDPARRPSSAAVVQRLVAMEQLLDNASHRLLVTRCMCANITPKVNCVSSAEAEATLRNQQVKESDQENSKEKYNGHAGYRSKDRNVY